MVEHWGVGVTDYFVQNGTGKLVNEELVTPDAIIKRSGKYSARITTNQNRDMDTVFFRSNAYSNGFVAGDKMHASIWYQTDGNADAQMAVLHHGGFDKNNRSSDLANLPKQPSTFKQHCISFIAGEVIILAVRVQGLGTLWVDDAFVGHGDGGCPPQ